MGWVWSFIHVAHLLTIHFPISRSLKFHYQGAVFHGVTISGYKEKNWLSWNCSALLFLLSIVATTSKKISSSQFASLSTSFTNFLPFPLFPSTIPSGNPVKIFSLRSVKSTLGGCKQSFGGFLSTS